MNQVLPHSPAEICLVPTSHECHPLAIWVFLKFVYPMMHLWKWPMWCWFWPETGGLQWFPLWRWSTCCPPSVRLLATGQCNVFLQGDHGELAVLQSSKPWNLPSCPQLAEKLHPKMAISKAKLVKNHQNVWFFSFQMIFLSVVRKKTILIAGWSTKLWTQRSWRFSVVTSSSQQRSLLMERLRYFTHPK